MDRIVEPNLRNVVGRTLYADMRRMEELLRVSDDIGWTVMRPARLFDAPAVSAYGIDTRHLNDCFAACRTCGSRSTRSPSR